jgi:nucleoside-diphosphate-sugar epimerase
MILVTGATGLVGSHLVLNLLQKGKEVKALKRSSSDISKTLKVFSYYAENAQELFDKITWVDVNLMDVDDVMESTAGAREIYHCAAMVSFAPRDKKKLLKYNSGITANLVNAALTNNISKFCFVSSVSVLDRSSEGSTSEKDFWKDDPSVSSYGISKYLSEMEVWRGVEEGVNATIVNPSLILGPGDWSSSSSVLFNTAAKGMPFYSSGTNGFVDVRDVANIMIELMEKNIFGKRFLLNSENWPFKKFFTNAALALDAKPPHINMPQSLSNFYWRFEWLRSLLFGGQPKVTKETAQSAYALTEYNSDKVREELGYSFIPVEKSIGEFSALYKNDQNQK